MTDTASPILTALSPEQWQDLEYRQPPRALDAWYGQKPERRPADDPTQYVAQMGITYDACVTLMNRAHERVDVPPPARPALAALALHGQPSGFTPDDVRALRQLADGLETRSSTAGAVSPEASSRLRALADRIAALLPPPDAPPPRPPG